MDFFSLSQFISLSIKYFFSNRPVLISLFLFYPFFFKHIKFVSEFNKFLLYLSLLQKKRGEEGKKRKRIPFHLFFNTIFYIFNFQVKFIYIYIYLKKIRLAIPPYSILIRGFCCYLFKLYIIFSSFFFINFRNFLSNIFSRFYNLQYYMHLIYTIKNILFLCFDILIFSERNVYASF